MSHGFPVPKDGIFDGADFLDVEKLVQVKKNLGVTISLIIPTLEEEDNIGRTLSIVNEKVGRELLDEVLVIDGGSRDRTIEIAREHGAHVVIANDILPQYGAKGKGVQLWKSLCVTKSDLIAYCDADISNFSEIFVLGLIGPLLVKPTYKYCKAFYKRALKVNGQTQEGGGGRVTEILARPVFSLYYPELRHIIQPLGGEYAGWRKDLERIAYTSGYGVETKLLLQFARVFGAEVICQSNLHEKAHRHQAIAALSKMSFVIVQTFMRDMADRYDIPLMVERMNHTLWIQKQTLSAEHKQRSAEHTHCNATGSKLEGKVGNFLEECDVNDIHLPPIGRVPEYISAQYPRQHKLSLLLCGHGQTHYQVEGKIMGWSDSTLTPEGVRQSEDLGRRMRGAGIKLSKVVSSDLARAVQTACAVITECGEDSVNLSTEKSLRAKGKGDFESKTKEDILLNRSSGKHWSLGKLSDPDQIPPGGEVTEDFRYRLINFLEKMALNQGRREARDSGETLIVTHHGCIWELYRFCYGVEHAPDLMVETDRAVGPILTEAELTGRVVLWRLDALFTVSNEVPHEDGAKRQRTGENIKFSCMQMYKAAETHGAKPASDSSTTPVQLPPRTVSRESSRQCLADLMLG